MTKLKKQKKKAEIKVPSKPTLLNELLFLMTKIIAILLVFLLICTYIFGIYRNQDESMAPAVKGGDLVIFYRLDKAYEARDILMLSHQGQKQVRRVVAVAGDTVDITAEGLYINGALQQELEIYTYTQQYQEGVEFPLTVRAGELFVLGDNRLNAADSRIYGVVAVSDTLGKVIMLFRCRNI